MKSVLALAALLLALCAGPALAHKVNIFATVEGGAITGEGYFGGGTKAQDVVVEVQDALGAPAGSTRTDVQGAFRLPIPQGATLPLRVVLKAGDGHQNDYPLTALDIGLPPGTETTPMAGASPALVSGSVPGMTGGAAALSADSPKAGATTGTAGGPMPAPAGGTTTLAPSISPATTGQSPHSEALSALVEASVAKAVEEKIAPLRMEINRLGQLSEKAQVRDIVGGLGWIAGLFGVVAFLRGRKK